MGTESEPGCQTGFCWYLHSPATIPTIKQETLDFLKYKDKNDKVLAANNRATGLGGNPVFTYLSKGLLYPDTPAPGDEL